MDPDIYVHRGCDHVRIILRGPVQQMAVKMRKRPAPDGEEDFAMALFFAADRWGNGTGIFHYADEARAILRECIHKGEPGIRGNRCGTHPGI